jgi:hypothetical protein
MIPEPIILANAPSTRLAMNFMTVALPQFFKRV